MKHISTEFNNNFNTYEQEDEGSFLSDNKINYTDNNKKYSTENYKKSGYPHYENLNTDTNYRNKYEKKPQKTIDEENYNSNSNNEIPEDKINPNNDLFSLSSKFFNECRNKIKKNEYFELIECLKKFNMNELDPLKTSKEIENILKNYEDLRKKFREIFKKMCNNK